MERGPLGLINSLILFGCVLLVMVFSTRESSSTSRSALPQPMSQTRDQSKQETPSQSFDVVEEAVAKLKLVWAALDGQIDENEIRRIASEWKNTTQNQVIPTITSWVRKMQEGQGEQLMREALDTLIKESAPVRLRILGELGRMLDETGPLREEASQLLSLWAQRLLGNSASELWNKLGY